MASPIVQMKVFGKTAGSTLNIPLTGLGNVAVANAFRNLGSWFQSIGIGARSFNGYVSSGGVQASGTITFSSIAAADTVTINGVIFTGTNGTPSGNQFKTGVTDTASATSLAAAINASTTGNIASTVTATSALGVTTVTMAESGLIGNLGTLAISAHGSVSGANMAGGTNGTLVALAKGL